MRNMIMDNSGIISQALSFQSTDTQIFIMAYVPEPAAHNGKTEKKDNPFSGKAARSERIIIH
ncbi:hypothetical protein [Tolumonas auensis]|uniref:hypothetical protein n=1 Tax=Tolumonas auensis TaxID=43948 RepID=UPI002AA6DDAC|nr:hypothetical protein [Tolumonas auensis]